MGDWGIKVSLPGKDISSSTPEDFVFSSKFGSVKTAIKGLTTISVPGSGSATLTIEHDLGFVPLCMVFSERTNGSGRYYFGSVYPGIDGSTSDPISVGSAYADSTNLVVRFDNSSGASKTIHVYYYIFGDAGQ